MVSTAPTYTTFQPAITTHLYPNMNILVTLPGGAYLREEGQGFGGLSFVSPKPSMPQLTGCEFQTNVLNTLASVISNQQFIINELKAIKRNTALTPAVYWEGGNTTTLENVEVAQGEMTSSVPILSLAQLTALKEKQENNPKTANSKAYLAVLINYERFNY